MAELGWVLPWELLMRADAVWRPRETVQYDEDVARQCRAAGMALDKAGAR
jgi:hypothetical protein